MTEVSIWVLLGKGNLTESLPSRFKREGQVSGSWSGATAVRSA
jgi:hypothetical protein